MLALPLHTGCTIGGTTYGWSTAPLVADAGLAQGTRTYGVWGQDNAEQSGDNRQLPGDVDSTNPSVTAAVVAMASPATVGWVRRSGSYTVYAKATDAGSPASGIATVTANVSSLTPGTTALALPEVHVRVLDRRRHLHLQERRHDRRVGHRRTASASVSLTAADKAGNTAAGSASATVDSTAPAVTGATRS